jgi:hypothetical protein
MHMSFVVSLIAAGVISYQQPPEPAPPEPLQVENVSPEFAIDELFVTQSGMDWGPDLLGGDDVLPGETLTVLDIPPGLYDVRLVDETGASCVLRNIDFERDPTFSFTGRDCYST